MKNMKNTNKKYIYPFSFVAFSVSKENSEFLNLIASTYFMKNLENFDVNKFINRVYSMDKISNRKSEFILVHVTNELIESSISRFSYLNTYDQLFIYKVSFENLFKDNFIQKYLLQNSQISNRIIYVFENRSWANIVANFRIHKIVISGGSNTKRHLLSPVHMRLAQFITCLEGLGQGGVFESFHNFDKDKISVKFDFTKKSVGQILETINENRGKETNKTKLDSNNLDSSDSNLNLDKSSNKLTLFNNKSNILNSSQISSNTLIKKCQQIREYHSSFKISNLDNKNLSIIVKDNKSMNIINKENSNIIVSYLNLLKQVINNNNLSPIQKQKMIEFSWIDLFKTQLEDNKYLINRYSHRLYNVLFEANKTLDILYSNKQLSKTFPFLHKELNKIEYLMLTFSLVITYYRRVGYTSLSTIVGNQIIYSVYKSKLDKFNNFDNNINNSVNFMTFEAFKLSINFKTTDNIKLGDYFISILSTFPTNLFEREYSLTDFNSDNSNLSDLARVKINSDYLDDIKDNIIIPPATLPMISEPVKWSENLSGGYIRNKEMGISVITGSNKHAHIVTNKDNLYKAVNYMSSIKFSVNNLLLDYLLNDGSYLLDIEDGDKFQREISIKIAKTFSNIPFYLTVHADWRGRLYTQSFFISYQGGDLSSALINFYYGEKLTSSGNEYLYIYGANNHNENNINKASYSERIKWVKNNYDKIINLNKELILSAEKPFIFASFCLIMRELDNNPDYLVKLPIFLDATCSGIQHFAALLQDFELGSKVNLIPQTDNQSVGDIYTEIINPINLALNKYGKENLDYGNLSLIKLTRKILKLSIMTKVYNVTNYGMAEQIKNHLKVTTSDILFKEKKRNKNLYLAPGIDGGVVVLNNADIAKIAQIINEEVFTLFPSLNYIYNYFIDISKLMIKLDIPLSWITPAGLKITQHYLKTKKSSIAIRFAGKTKKMILKEWTDRMDTTKQSQAIIPNIIHSLDANHLINLLNKASDSLFYPVITVHDCFGTHPNKMGELEHMVKKEFILLYTKEQFLQKFHDRIIESIIDNNYIIENENDISYVIDNNRKTHKIPNLPKLGTLDLQKIIESKYMIT